MEIKEKYPYIPIMADLATLDEAVKLMLKYQVGTTLPQQDVNDIVAFLESLNGVYTPYPIH